MKRKITITGHLIKEEIYIAPIPLSLSIILEFPESTMIYKTLEVGKEICLQILSSEFISNNVSSEPASLL